MASWVVWVVVSVMGKTPFFPLFDDEARQPRSTFRETLAWGKTMGTRSPANPKRAAGLSYERVGRALVVNRDEDSYAVLILFLIVFILG